MSKPITKNSVVTMHVVIADPAGHVLDSTRDSGQPLVYVHGSGSLLPALEEKLEGKTAGERLLVSLLPEKAFGVIDPNLEQVVPEAVFEDMNLKVGMQLGSQSDSHQIRTVTKVENGQVTLDANHPWAGKTLDFDIEVIMVRAATAAEVESSNSPQ